jgi:hypothetical protein
VLLFNGLDVVERIVLIGIILFVISLLGCFAGLIKNLLISAGLGYKNAFIATAVICFGLGYWLFFKTSVVSTVNILLGGVLLPGY